MAFHKTHNIAVKTGSYTDRDGKDRNRYEYVGYVLTSDDGGKMHFLNRTFNPAGVPKKDGESDDAVLLSIFEIKPKGDGGNHTSESSGDDIPF